MIKGLLALINFGLLAATLPNKLNLKKIMEITSEVVRNPHLPKRWLILSGKLWFALAFIGQSLFIYYVSGFYGIATLKGNFDKWNEGLPKGYIEGDPVGNLAVGLHLIFAILIIFGGFLQLMPAVRQWSPKFHRMNGKLYLFNAFIMGLSGLYMVWIRGAIGGMVGHVAISINALLMMTFSIMVWKTAVNRRFDLHQQWTYRLFLVVSGVWFFRVGLMAWIFINGGPVGFNPETLIGPFINFLVFAQYLIPLAVLELFYYAKKQKNPSVQWAMVVGMLVFTVITANGIFGATMGIWIPRLS